MPENLTAEEQAAIRWRGEVENEHAPRYSAAQARTGWILLGSLATLTHGVAFALGWFLGG